MVFKKYTLLQSNKLALFGLTVFFLITSSYLYRNKAFSLRFVDEEDNFAIGKYLSKGEILYDDIITNHQPFTYLFSEVVHKITKPQNTYLLINRHRETMIIWSFIWSILLVLYFGWAGLIAVLVYELTKIYLLGNLFLAEAQIVYPLMFLGGLICFYKNKLNNLELFLLGVSFSLAIFLLMPLWPAVFFLFLVLLIRQRISLIHTFRHLFIGAVVSFLVLFKFISIPGYFYYSLYANLFYTVPSYHAENWLTTISKALLTPFLAFFPVGPTPTARVIQVLSVLLIVNMSYLIFKKRYFKTFIILILLGLGNIRFVYPGTELYDGFHLLPWYATMILVVFLVSADVLKNKGNLLLKSANLSLIIFVLGLSLNFAKADLFEKKNTWLEYNINYSTHTNRGDAVRVMKSAGDTLFVSPNAWLVYWQSDADHLPKLYGYYPWMSGVPKIHLAVLEAFSKNPPTFFYCENCGGLDLEKYLVQYQEIKNYGKESMLYVYKDKIAKLTTEQLDQLKFYGFAFD